MRIAIVSTPFVRVPPPGYGGTELFCGTLAEALLRRGHDVTLFATGDSRFSGELRACFEQPSWPPTDAIDRTHARFCMHEISRARIGYDAVQVNSPACIAAARDLGIPVVYTIHHTRDEKMSKLYDAHPEVHYVAISQRQLELETPFDRASVIHHGIDVDAYPTSLGDDGYVLHLGRFSPEKGTHHAIDAAAKARVPIVIAGRVHEKDEDARYYREELIPRFEQPGVIRAGEADHRRKASLLRGARALLCPVQWEEPFGLISIEAMVCGTPVIAFARGALPEIIDDGVTGMIVSDVDQMAEAIARARHWDRKKCMARARDRFSADRMAREYEQIFEAKLRQSGPHRLTAENGIRLTRLIG
jgi:glycosyltransferase involved in cell wall biosynthesis